MHVRSLCLFVTMSVMSAGCAATQADEEPAVGQEGGLALAANTSDHVAGSFTRGDASLVFDFARRDGVRIAELHDGAGRHLLTAKLVDGIETLRVRDGRLEATGAPDSLEPHLVGDASALEEIGKTKEMALLGPLEEALAARSVDRGLFAVTGQESRLTPKQYLGSDGYWHLGPGEKRTFGTWAFWSSTYVRIRNYTTYRCATVVFRVGWGLETQVIPAGGYRGFSRQWAAIPVTIENLNAWVDWGGGQVCGPVTIGAMTQ